MGGCINKPKPVKILILGLDNAGKSSCLHKIETGTPIQNSQPTISFKKTDIRRKNMIITFVDVSGSEMKREFWDHYYSGTSAIIYVVDSSDRSRMKTAQECLDNALKAYEIKPTLPLLVFANKSDKTGILSSKQIEKELKLNQLKNRPWNCATVSAVSQNNDIQEGLDWLLTAIENQFE